MEKIKGEKEGAVWRRAKEGVVVEQAGGGAGMKSAAVSLILEWFFCSVIVVMLIR